MNLYQLECFFNLSQTLNFTRTAEQMYTSQSALSRSMSTLEKEINLTLIIRNPHSVSLTPAGLIFADTCRKLLMEYHKGIEASRMLSDAQTGTLRFGLPNDSFEEPAIRFFHHLRKKYPGINIDLRIHSPSGLFQALSENRVDFIVTSVEADSPVFSSILIEKRVECAVVSAIHPLANQNKLSMKDLRNEKFIMISPNASPVGSKRIIQYAASAGYVPQIVSEAASVPGLLAMVACDLGVSVLYKEHQIVSEEYVRFIPLSDIAPHNRYFMWRKSSGACKKTVIQAMQEYFQLFDCC